MPLDHNYLEELKKRGKESRVYQPFQLAALEIADMLGDRKHKSLYMRVLKNGNADELRGLAKTVAENKNVKNKGAYFMSLLKKK